MSRKIARWSRGRRIACASVATLLTLAPVPGTPRADAASFERRVQAAAGGRLEVDLRSGGDVTVRAGAVDAVVVRAEGGGVAAPLTVRSDGARIVVVSTRDARPDLRVHVDVPARFDARVDSAGGDISLHGVDGRHALQTLGGDLAVTAATGTMDLVTAGGEILVADVEGACTVRSAGGNVRLERVSADVDASTLGGQIVATGAAGGRFELRTTGGDVVVDEAPDGSVLETLGGSIRVARAAGDLTVETEGGHVEALGVIGSLRATTRSGDLTAEIVGAPARVRLDALQGDIRLIVPAALGARWDVDVSWNRAAADAGAIDSDVPLELRRSSGRDAALGEPRQYLAGRGVTGDARTHVAVRVVNGDVTIRTAR